MPFCFFPDYCPETAMRETWRFTLPQAQHGLEAGDYFFLESYCDEPDCDCRRVWLTVKFKPPGARPGRLKGPLATIGYGWESPAFYQEWASGDPEAGGLAGARLEPLQPQGRQAEAVLAMTSAVILSPPANQRRIRDHYAALRKAAARA